METNPDLIVTPHPYDVEDINEFSSLKDAREYVEDARAQPRGGSCPCCDQHVKNYRYSISRSMALALVSLYHLNVRNNDTFVSKEDLFKVVISKSAFGGGSFASMVRWGLIEEKSSDDKTKGRCSGYWRITEKGKSFVKNEIRLPKYVHSYNNKVFFRDDKEMVSILDAMNGESFDYEKIMSEAVANPEK